MNNWKKSLIAICVMQFLGLMAMAQFMPFLPFYIQSLGVQDMSKAVSWAGVIFGIGFLFAGLMAPVWGNLADKYGRKRMVLRAMLGSALALILMAYARNVTDLFVLRMFHGLLGGFVSAITALVIVLAPKDKVGFAVGAQQSALLAGVIGGPLVGGVFVDVWGFRPLLLCSAGLLIIGVSVFYFLVPDDRFLLKKNEAGTIFDNYRFVFKSKMLSSASLIQFLVQTAFMCAHPVLALLVKVLAPESQQWGILTGLVFGVTAAAALFGSMIWGRLGDRRGHVRILQACLFGAGLAFVPQAFVPSVMMLILLRILLGYFMGGVQPSLNSLVAHGSVPERQAGVLGVTMMGSLFGNGLGPVLGGFLGAVMGLRAPFLLAALLLLVAWVISRWQKEPAPVGVTVGEGVL